MNRCLACFFLFCLLASLGCEAQLVCELCGEDHSTSTHVEESMNGTGGLETATMADDELLLRFVAGRRSDGFSRVNQSPYPSAVSDKRINVFVSNFALADYLKIAPETETSDGMIPRGSFVVREIVDADGEVSSLTALYRGPQGYNPQSGDFWFATTDPDGHVVVESSGRRLIGPLTACSGCHANRDQADYLFGVPQDARVPMFAHGIPGLDDAPSAPQTENVEPTPDPTPSEPAPQPEELATPTEPQAPQPPAARLVDLVIANVQPDNAREQMTQITVDVAQPRTVVIARDATRAEFEAYWGAMPADVVYINQGGTGSFGAPIVNGGEVWVIRDSSGTVLDGPTVAGTAENDFVRTSSDPTAWAAQDEASATPGVPDVTLPPGVWITEWSDAGTYAMEFIEISIQ